MFRTAEDAENRPSLPDLLAELEADRFVLSRDAIGSTGLTAWQLDRLTELGLVRQHGSHCYSKADIDGIVYRLSPFWNDIQFIKRSLNELAQVVVTLGPKTTSSVTSFWLQNEGGAGLHKFCFATLRAERILSGSPMISYQNQEEEEEEEPPLADVGTQKVVGYFRRAVEMGQYRAADSFLVELARRVR